ncbi:MAG: 16S rRNA (cytidine(1402)-2'-O)-methyltransferase [Candidatus Buchananbacteria bacterium]|nr:16S rRNA (cytidine(1402)-2'-O)-methyltransferase [Candidatus Buchananbacteria bacterium]
MGILYVVSTPIGNLKDITLRALEILKTVDVIACEDTRVTKRLLDHYQIVTPTVSYHQHSKVGKVDFLISKLQSGKHVALVSDAGTPGISDPGGLLVASAVAEGITVESVPGASALTAALALSGFPTDRFTFFGFLPHKKGRETLIKKIIESDHTVVFYESVHRIIKALEQLIAAGLTRQIVVARELTKKFETVYRGTAQEVLNNITNEETKGEFVVVIGNK